MKIGFEIEVEGISDIIKDVPGIIDVPEGSLRNGVEYVSKVLPDPAFAKSLYSYMYNRIEGTYSDRCGFHFHLDFTDKPKEFITGFLKRYLVIERTLFKTFPSFLRSNNSFCNLLMDSPDELNLIRNMTNGVDYRESLEDFSKYSALNTRPLLTLGTMEFRACVGGITPEEFSTILDIFTSLYNNKTPPIAFTPTAKDEAEATAQINLINTPVEVIAEDLGDFMEYHFPSPSATALTLDAVKDYLRNN